MYPMNSRSDERRRGKQSTMAEKKVIVRVQSPEGTKRLELLSTDNTASLFEKIHELFNLSNFNFLVYKDKERRHEILSSRSKLITTLKLTHGDTLYLFPPKGYALDVEEPEPVIVRKNSASGSTPSSLPPAGTLNGMNRAEVQEDDVDITLQKSDGRIERQQDPHLCHHGPNAKCLHCSALEPYNETYLKEHNIKHLSFHSYIRKLTSGVDRGKFTALEDIRCSIKSGCTRHPPWPKGICSMCQPNAITLDRQSYRHVDNVMFENPKLVEQFLNYWRTTGHQRLGLLFGYQDIHKDVPLGIKAVVAAIYEPPQDSNRDMIKLLPNPSSDLVNSLANQLGLTCIGWIFTDLVAEDIAQGTVKHHRNMKTHFLSAQEVIMAATLQNEHPNPCRLSSTGYFGSKFVTVCVTGDQNNQVHMEGYQVSNQGMALVRESCLIPTKDAPELGYVRESTNEKYVPDVFFKEKDSYGNEITKLARPLPIEYLLLDVPVSTPMQPQYTFNYTLDPKIKPFPIENRLIDGQYQNFDAMSTYLRQFSNRSSSNRYSRFLELCSDFHFLLHLMMLDNIIPSMREIIGPLLEAVRNKDSIAAQEWASGEAWATIEQLLEAQGSGPSSFFQSLGSPELEDWSHLAAGGSMDTASGGGGSSESVPSDKWVCAHCTFFNPLDNAQCEMCGLPR